VITKKLAKTYLIVGAGFTGAVLAERIASQLGQRAILIDRRDHTGRNAYDHFNEYSVSSLRDGLSLGAGGTL
jgi:UDP-galactopyranose mutase